jgi:hypothetical protein
MSQQVQSGECSNVGKLTRATFEHLWALRTQLFKENGKSEIVDVFFEMLRSESPQMLKIGPFFLVYNLVYIFVH